MLYKYKAILKLQVNFHICLYLYPDSYLYNLSLYSFQKLIMKKYYLRHQQLLFIIYKYYIA
jgi:hypothetical protein